MLIDYKLGHEMSKETYYQKIAYLIGPLQSDPADSVWPAVEPYHFHSLFHRFLASGLRITLRSLLKCLSCWCGWKKCWSAMSAGKMSIGWTMSRFMKGSIWSCKEDIWCWKAYGMPCAKNDGACGIIRIDRKYVVFYCGYGRYVLSKITAILLSALLSQFAGVMLFDGIISWAARFWQKTL